ncbi:MFS transporter [Streptomyces sp. SBR177]
MAFLGVSVVYIAFPELPESFPDASLSLLSWVVSGYTVVFAATLAPAGRLADVIGLRRLFTLSVAGFTVGSLLCALAPTVELLIAASAIQGLFAAGMVPSSLALLLASRPPHERAKAIGLWGASSSAAAAAGTPLGGFLVHSFGWPSVFLVNVPLGAALLALAWWVLPRVRVRAAAVPDLLGTVALLLGVGGLVAALTQGSSWGWGSAPSSACSPPERCSSPSRCCARAATPRPRSSWRCCAPGSSPWPTPPSCCSARRCTAGCSPPRSSPRRSGTTPRSRPVFR